MKLAGNRAVYLWDMTNSGRYSPMIYSKSHVYAIRALSYIAQSSERSTAQRSEFAVGLLARLPGLVL
jgi:hypothetical protein